MADTQTPLEPDCYYHIFNHAVGFDNLFCNSRHYNIFLKSIRHYILRVAELYAYCLMPNHFHLVIKILSESELYEIFRKSHKNNIDLNRELSYQFGHCFNSYAQIYNHDFERKGSIFANRFKRNRILSKGYLLRVIRYIHLNPVNHGMCDHPSEWTYSSYNKIINGSQSALIKTTKIISCFEDLDNFVYYHSIINDLEDLEPS